MIEKQTRPKTKATAKTTAKPKAVTSPVMKPRKKEAVNKSEDAKTKLVSTEELANFVGVDVRRIQQLTQDGVVKKEPGNKRDAKYKFLVSIHSLLQYYRLKSDSRRSSDSDEMATEKLKQISVKRKLEELKLSQLEGVLHKAEDIERIMGAMLTRLRINLLAIAPALRGMGAELDIIEKVDERIRRAMNEVADLDLKKLVEDEYSATDDS